MVRNFEWERLHKKLEGKLSKLKQKRRQKSTKKTKADQIIEEVRKGHLSKAARKLQSKSGFRDLSVPENRETAKNLYPRSEQVWTPPDRAEIPDWKPAILEQDEFQSFDSLDLALRRLPKGRTPGLSGMFYEFVTLLCTDQELRSTLKELTVLITNQKLNETIHNIMATSLFIPLAKGDKGIRPIGVAEVLKRWAAIALVLEVQHEGIPEKLSHQYGVCLPSGAEMVHKAISQPISTSTHNIMLRNWTLLMPSIPSQEKPSLRAQSSWPLYYFHTSTPSILQQHPSLSHDQNHTLTMEEGVQQGDPLGTIFFCLGFHGILNPIFQKVDAPLNALLLLLSVDDIFVCGSLVAIAEITTQIQSVLPNANLKLGTERGKMVCFSPEAPRSNDLKNLGIGKAEVITVLGSPIGLNTQISKWLHTLAQEYQQASQDHCLIMFSNPHESLELFVKTITPKLTYICRTTPLSLTPFQDFIKQTTTTNINYLLNPLQVPHLHPNKELHLS